MENEILIPVYIADAEAKKFLLFQQHYELFNLLLEKGVFEQSNATVSLDFDKFGALKAIRRSDFLYTTK